LFAPTIDASNVTSDLDANGIINIQDLSAVKAKLFTNLPATCP
jgi:hypothetical protein